MSKNEEITAVYLSERFRFENASGDTVIAECRMAKTGDADKDSGVGVGDGNGDPALCSWCGNVHAGGTEKCPTPTPETLDDVFDVLSGRTNGRETTNGNGIPHAGDIFKVKGEADVDELKPHSTYRFLGHWTKYTNKRTGETERQFAFSSFVRALPHDRAGIIAYLRHAGKGRGIGQAKAMKLWEAFGPDAVRVLRETPEVACEKVKILKPHEAEAAAKQLQEDVALESCMIELTDLLNGRGFPKGTARNAVRQWGNRAADIIRRDPYQLMNFRGCGFKRADAMYLDLGHDPKATRRQALCAWYTLASDSNGHTWFPADFALAGIRQSIGGVNVDPLKAMQVGQRLGRMSADSNGALAVRRTDGPTGPLIGDRRLVTTESLFGEPWQRGLWVAEGKKASQEEYLARRIAEKLREKTEWPSVKEIKGLSEHQLHVTQGALTGPLSILRGGPGTGKSYATARIIAHLQRCFGVGSVAACAPTNKAANRLTQALAEYEIDLTATSIHRLLGVESSGRGGWSFLHNEDRPLPYKALVIDEGSMPPTSLTASLFRAVPRGMLILIVGDTNQLPPIEHGAPMRDMLACGLVPSGELTEPQRNSGTMVHACDDIRLGRRFREADRLDLDAKPPQNFRVVTATTPEQQIESLLAIIEKAKARDLDPIWDVQAMVAVNKKSAVSRSELNRVLQVELNSGGFTIPGNPFRVGDKVVCTDNGMFPCRDPRIEEVFVANGEFGRVVAVEEKSVSVDFDFPDRQVRFPKGKASSKQEEETAENYLTEKKNENGCAIDLAYACTVHKMQGSEVAVGVPILDEYAGAKRISSREWFFTAISRGKLLSLPIGRRSTADAMCRRTSLDKRKTFLAELIQQEYEGMRR